MSYLMQMAGLTVHNFVSAAHRHRAGGGAGPGFRPALGADRRQFLVDLTRITLYVLLPLSIVVGLFFVWQGMPQNLHAYVEATSLEGGKQVIAQGPVASRRSSDAGHQTAAGSSTPTPRTPTRTPTHSATSCRSC